LLIRVEQDIQRLGRLKFDGSVQGIGWLNRFQFNDLSGLGCSWHKIRARSHGDKFAHMGDGQIPFAQRVQHCLAWETQGASQTNFEIAA
jgi:hypothetical protein